MPYLNKSPYKAFVRVSAKITVVKIKIKELLIIIIFSWCLFCYTRILKQFFLFFSDFRKKIKIFPFFVENLKTVRLNS